MIGKFAALVAALAVVPTMAQASDIVLLHAAGSLRGALTEVAKGFEAVAERSLHGLKAPFREHVILRLVGKENSIEIPPLGDDFLAMSLGIEYSAKRLKAGARGTISVIQQTAVPKIDLKKRCYETERVTVGGFTFNLDVHDSRRVPKRAGRSA